MKDLEYEERAEKVMPKWSSWGDGIVEIKRSYWYESRDRIISILKQLHRAKKQAKQIKELEAEIKKLRSIKCPPISDGDSCICPIEELEDKVQELGDGIESMNNKWVKIRRRIEKRNVELEAEITRLRNIMNARA